MKLLNFLLLLAACACLTDAQQTQPACTSTTMRYEVRSVSSARWTMMIRNLARMRDAGWFAWFSRIHATNFGSIHGNSQFFPFHRRFVQDFERVGKAFNSGFIVPYWDSARDYAAPQNSAVLTSAWIGGNGASGSHCVTNGIQGGWTMTYPNTHCLSRQYDNGSRINPWYSPEFILSRLLSDTTMAALRPDIEYSIHGAVHLGLAGDMSTTYSSNDFAFYMHHANLDRLWWKWQITNNKIWVMDGPGPNGISNLTINNNITYYNEPIRNVMQLGYGDMCFTYADSAPLTGTSTASSESAAASNVQSTSLSPSLKQSLFPGTNSSTSLRRRGNVRKNKKLMPHPHLMPESFARMHKYNYDDVKAHYKAACDFVDILNNSDYEPLYCY